jgi:putative addiction module killer protein
MYEVRHYFTREGRDLYSHWRDGIRDRQAAIAIDRRVNRLELGNFGDCKPCRDGVWEPRIDTGSGYRVYYAIAGKTVVLLLCAGDKRTQSGDIDRACLYWRDWKGRDDERSGT